MFSFACQSPWKPYYSLGSFFFDQKAFSVEEFVPNFHHSLSPSLFSPIFFFTALCFPVSPHARTHLNFPPSIAAVVMYQLQLTTSQVGLRDILDHGGAASSLCASSLPPDFSPRPHWGLVPGRAERHLAKPQKHFQLQTAWCSPQRESRPKVEERTKSYHITIYISLKFMYILIAVSNTCSSVKS